jgi:protein-export membrane protein SecD
MWRKRIIAFILLLAGAGLGYSIYAGETASFGPLKKPFKYGLDIKGGTQLVYEAHTEEVASGDVAEVMEGLRNVIELRVNAFGVSEPIVQTEVANTLSGSASQRLIIELPGVTDIAQAVELIGQTPLLEFKTERPEGEEKTRILEARAKAEEVLKDTSKSDEEKSALLGSEPLLLMDPEYVSTELTGKYLDRATLTFDQTTNEPQVALEFNDEGRQLFADITKANVGKTVAIYLDGTPISAPVVREAILDGKAEISGGFDLEEARKLVQRLNSGALPVSVTLLSTQTIGATLGEKALDAGVRAGIFGVLLVSIFLIVWYRIPGVIAVLALLIYVVIMLTVFKLISVTLTAAGIAGFILSIGMAVDANILIFERMKEELKKGKDLHDAMHDGFSRAWLSIRDSNVSSLISTLILFWFGSSLIKGFALTLCIGVLVSMFSAITVSRTFLYALGTRGNSKAIRFLFGSGLT